MQQTLENFLRALRAADIRVSPAEAIDAHRTVDVVGYGQRQLLKDSLCVTLAKTAEEVERYEECFELFFSRDEFRAGDEGGGIGAGAEGLSEAETEML
ncbi:MAG: VWA containing CoxE family protein, partial [Alphaproteobacteria bacterium]|nr:VWA containing CoxE family protein [Alphaproteobacteria bacterium]